MKNVLPLMLLVALGWGRAVAADLTPAQTDFFEKKIRPVLADNCYKCHSTQAEKVKGGLLLDSRDGLLKGGDTGVAIVPGNPEASLLIKAVRYTDPDLQMPKNKKLDDDQIADLVAWVKMGAPDPRTATADQRLMPTCSPSIKGESMVTISGWTKKIASVSAIGR